MEETREEFSGLYDQYIERIYRFVYLKVSTRDVAEDLCSEIFLRLWNEFSKEKEILNQQAFLYQIARHVLADHYREQEKVRIVPIEAVLDTQDTQSPIIEEQAIQNLEIERIRRILKVLKEEYQNYIIWRYIDELTISEIAAINEKTEDSTRVGVHRALQALRRELENAEKE